MQEATHFSWIARIKRPIVGVVQEYIPVDILGLKFMTVWEIGGELSASLIEAYPGAHCVPTTGAPELLQGIDAGCKGLPSVQPGRCLDLTQEDWSLTDKLNAIVAIHLTQEGPWEGTLGLMAGAGKYLVPGGFLFIYGPFLKDGQYMSETDEAYDMSLRMRNPDRGYRELADMKAAGEAQGLRQEAIHNMPANNFTLVYRKPL